MKKLIMMLAVFSSFSFADDLVVTVIPPTAWSNGDSVQLGDVARYEIGIDCAGDITTVNTDQTTHTFENVPSGVCTISASAVDNNGVFGAVASTSATTGNSLSAPTVAVVVDTGGDLDSVLAACTASPSCIVISGQ